MYKHKFYSKSAPTTANAGKTVTTIKQRDTVSGTGCLDSDDGLPKTGPTRIELAMQNDMEKDDPSTLFNDGVRKIDFVLVIVDPLSTNARHQESSRASSETERLISEDVENADEVSKKLRKHQRMDLWRQRFMGRIVTQGLEVEEEVLHQEQNILRFIKIHAPWNILCRYAEDLNIQVPIQEVPKTEEGELDNGSEMWISYFCCPNIMYQNVPNKPPKYYTAPFKLEKLHKFIGKDDPDTFFSRSQRSRMVYEILETTVFGKEKKGEVGIDRLVADGAYAAAFPLHDGPYETKTAEGNDAMEQQHPNQQTYQQKTSALDKPLNERQLLYEYWARWGKWYKYQPLDHIRNYFGEKVAIYFAWLGFYTGWLLPAMVVGVLVFLYGLLTVGKDSITHQVCTEGKNYTMCPICDVCPYYQLSDNCFARKAGYLFDNGANVFYAVFMSFWAVFFLEFWKRKAASLAHEWNCMDLDELETPRPEFAAKAPYREKNKITGKEEPSFPDTLRLKRMIFGGGVIVMMIVVVFIVLMAVILYRVFVSIPLAAAHVSFLMIQPSIIASSTGAILQIACIMILGQFYERLALMLTKWEMHRTQSDFEDNLTFKVFLFQFINFNSSIFYVAFFKGKFVGIPGDYNTFMFNVRNESCSSSGCSYDLMLQLMWILGITLFRNYAMHAGSKTVQKEAQV